MKLSLLSLVLLPVADAFTTPMIANDKRVSTRFGRISASSRTFSMAQDQDHDQKPAIEENVKESKYMNSLSAVSATLCLLSSEVANAAGPDWGKIFKELLVRAEIMNAWH